MCWWPPRLWLHCGTTRAKPDPGKCCLSPAGVHWGTMGWLSHCPQLHQRVSQPHSAMGRAQTLLVPPTLCPACSTMQVPMSPICLQVPLSPTCLQVPTSPICLHVPMSSTCPHIPIESAAGQTPSIVPVLSVLSQSLSAPPHAQDSLLGAIPCSKPGVTHGPPVLLFANSSGPV